MHFAEQRRLMVDDLSACLRLHQLGLENVRFQVADGSLGWQPSAPYDAIIVSASSPEIPQALVDQLSLGGRLVLPVGPHQAQTLVSIEWLRDGTLKETAPGLGEFDRLSA